MVLLFVIPVSGRCMAYSSGAKNPVKPKICCICTRLGPKLGREVPLGFEQLGLIVKLWFYEKVSLVLGLLIK